MSPYSHSDTATHINQANPPPPYVTYDQNFQCDPNNADSLAVGTLGVTLWRNPISFGGGRTYIIPPYGNQSISFTGTQPQCYAQKDSCNIHFNPIVLAAGQPSVELKFTLNEPPANKKHLIYMTGNYGQGGAQQSYDLAPEQTYNDAGFNNLVIYNMSPVSVELIDFQIIRTYRMYTLGTSCPPASVPPGSGNLDDLRIDYPCTTEQCGGRSYSHHINGDHKDGVLAANGGSFTWNFDWSLDWTPDHNNRYNYVQGAICLLNFNQMRATQTDPNPYVKDILLVAELNGMIVETFRISKFADQRSFPATNLMMSPYYNDTGPNQIRLINYGTRPVRMVDDLGIDIYRIYETQSLCPPPHSDHGDTCTSPDLLIGLSVSGVATIPAQVTFVVDGNNYPPDSNVCLSPGAHNFSVDQYTSDPYGNYVFSYWDVVDGSSNHLFYVYDNPASINIESPAAGIFATYTTY
jgi:hypothetical protein